jgi:hypothetical protein
VPVVVVAVVSVALIASGCGRSTYAGLTANDARALATKRMHQLARGTSMVALSADREFDPQSGRKAWRVEFGIGDSATSAERRCSVFVWRGGTKLGTGCPIAVPAKLASIQKTRACLSAHDAVIGHKLDLIAKGAPGGAFSADLPDNSVRLAFGRSDGDARKIVAAYTHIAFSNVHSGLPDVLRRYNNVVTLWHQHPQQADLALVIGCLR